MKKLLIKSWLPVLALMLAVGGAFASVEGNLEDSGREMAIVLGHTYLNNNCETTQKSCTTVNNGNICTDQDNNSLRDPNCFNLVYEIPNN